MKKDKPMTTHVMGLFDESFESIILYKHKNELLLVFICKD